MDETVTLVPRLLILALLLVFSGLFSASETALLSLNEAQRHQMATARDRRSRLVAELVREPHRLLTTILVGNNLVNVAASSLATVVAIDLLGEGPGVAVATALLTVLVLLFGEITPKSVAASAPQRVSRSLAPFVRLTMRVLSPVALVLGAISRWLVGLGGAADTSSAEAQIRALAQAGVLTGELNPREARFIQRVMAFADRPVHEIMIPRVRISAFSADTTYNQVVERVRQTGFSRFPVYQESIDEIVGVVVVKNLFIRHVDPEPFDLLQWVEPGHFVPESKNGLELFRELKARRHHMAIVVDEYGGTAGVVTLEDLLEEVFGEIEDEHDRPMERMRRRPGGGWLVDGGQRIDEVWETLGLGSPPDVEANTVGGLVLEMLERLPQPGDTVSVTAATIAVVRHDGARVLEVEVTPTPP